MTENFRDTRLWMSLVTLLALGLFGCGEVPDPLVSGESLRTLRRGFESVREKGQIVTVTYSIDVGPANPLTKPIYLEARFENPTDPASPVVSQSVLAPGMKKLNVYSPKLTRLEKGKVYKVDISLYDTADRTKRLGVHTQLIAARESYQAR